MKPYPYQVEGVEFLASRPRALLCDAPGLGKTMQAILAAEQLSAARVLVVCPNLVKWQWCNEVRKWTDFAVLVCGQGREGAALFEQAQPAWKYNVIHWDALRLLPDSFFKLKWDVLITDEVHYMCNRKAQRTEAIKRIKADHKWGLSATPYRNWVDDLWSILHWLDKKRWSSYWRFYKDHIVYLDMGEYRQIMGECNLDKLATALQDVVLARHKSEVAQWLPPLTETVVPVELSSTEWTDYEYRRKNLKVDDKFILNPLQRTTLLRRATSEARVRAARELIRAQTTPTLAFTYYQDTAKALRPDAITGSTPQDVRERTLKSFMAEAKRYRVGDGRLPLLIMTIGVGGVGLDLDEADTVIFAGLSWSSVEMQQALERIHRVTSVRPKHAYYVVAKDTIDEVVLWAASSKADRQAAALAAIRHVKGGEP